MLISLHQPLIQLLPSDLTRKKTLLDALSRHTQLSWWSKGLSSSPAFYRKASSHVHLTQFTISPHHSGPRYHIPLVHFLKQFKSLVHFSSLRMPIQHGVPTNRISLGHLIKHFLASFNPPVLTNPATIEFQVTISLQGVSSNNFLAAAMLHSQPSSRNRSVHWARRYPLKAPILRHGCESCRPFATQIGQNKPWEETGT